MLRCVNYNMQDKNKVKLPAMARVLNYSKKEIDWVDTDVVREAMVSGQLGIGKNGNSVTISIEDDVTGEMLEFSNVKNALLMIEEKRKSSSGWLSLLIGDESKLKEVIGFLAQVTLDSLRKMRGR